MNKIIIPAIVTALTLSTAAWSKGNHHYGHGKKHSSSTDWAKVIKVEDITRTVEHNTPSEVCWTEEVRYEHSKNTSNSHSGTILGGIIGGALGNAVGHKKKNKQIGTAIGAVLGATVGYDISNRNKSHPSKRVTYRDERKCETRDHITYEEETVGYHVWYRYFGNEYKTRMSNQPGDKIKVRVKVEPY